MNGRCKEIKASTLGREFEVQKEMYEQKIQELQARITRLEDQLFELAKRPQQIITNQRADKIVNQLAPMTLTAERVDDIVRQHFTKEVFLGGPTKIAEFTAQTLLTDPESKMQLVAVTDPSRSVVRFLNPETQTIETDVGFHKTHELIRRPLHDQNIAIFLEHFRGLDDESFREQWSTNSDFITDVRRFLKHIHTFLG